MLEKLDNVVFSSYGLGRDDIDCDVVSFFSHDMDLNIIDLNNIKLDDNFDEHNPETIIQLS